MENPSPQNQQAVVEVDASRVLTAVRRGLPMIAGLSVLGAVAAVAYTFFQAPIFESRASIVLPAPQGPDAILGVGGASAPIHMYAHVLHSESVMSAVAGELGLRVRDLRRRVDVSPQDRARMIRIAFRSHDEEEAIRGTQLLLERLRHEDERLKLVLRAEVEAAIREAISQRTKDLATAEASLQAARERGYLGAADAQPLAMGLRERRIELGSVVSSLEALRSSLPKTAAGVANLPEDVGPSPTLRKELDQAQLQLALVRLRHGDEAPEFVTAQERVTVLEARFRNQLEGYARTIMAGVADGQPGTVMQTLTELTVRSTSLKSEIAALEQVVAEYPDQARQVESLAARAVTLRELVATLEVRYELAQIEAVNDPNRWEVMDQPFLLDEPINKRYARSGLTGFLLGGLLGLAIASRGRGG